MADAPVTEAQGSRGTADGRCGGFDAAAVFCGSAEDCSSGST
ncbi:hypothetical protein [Streptomyces sp. NBC_00154]|nr:hypothetical protein [Streptomyces sp. NBC_00154]MCX5314780.1 hypothetical protein [Streptomyces sp. NBC_00154]